MKYREYNHHKVYCVKPVMCNADEMTLQLVGW